MRYRYLLVANQIASTELLSLKFRLSFIGGREPDSHGIALGLKFPEITFKKCNYTCFQLDDCSSYHIMVGFSIGLYLSPSFHDTAAYMHKPSALTGANLMENVDICADSVYQAFFLPTNESLGPMP